MTAIPPPEIYDAIKEWVNENIKPLSGHRILRPFRPGGDYEAEDYQEGDIVLDNPPFSILAKIINFYCSREIEFFLFAPALTLFNSPNIRCTYIVANADIIYENGANVKTSFITNMEGRNRIWVAGDLCRLITDLSQRLSKKDKKEITKISYPPEMVSGALLGKIVTRGISFKVPMDEAYFVRKLDNQIKSIFGGGYLLSERAAAERAAAERAAAERAAAERVELSDREIQIIQRLSNTTK